MTGYVAWMTLLVAVYYGVAPLRIETWGLIGLSGVLAIAVGVFINRPVRAAPWLLLAGANLSFAIGQMMFLVFTHILDENVPFPSIADVFYLATYPLYAAGVLIFIRWRTAGRDRQSLLDALTLIVGLALLSWIYLILPYASNPGLSWVQKAFAIAYPLGDVLVLAMLFRLLAPGSGRTRSVQLLTLGTAGMLMSDVSFGLTQLYGSFTNGTVIDLGWAIFYGAWGAAALHPTMAELTRPVSPRQGEGSPLRLALLMLASLIAPVVLFVEAIQGTVLDGGVIAVFSAVLFLLVLSRLSYSAASHRWALGRERVLRLAGASLASAVTVEEAASAVRTAVATLISPNPQREALLTVREEGELRAVGATPDGGPAVHLDQLDEMAQTWMSLVTPLGTHLMRAAQLAERARSDVSHVSGPSGDGSVLLCPLTLKDRPSGDPLIGVLLVFGEERVLAALSGTLEILARQVALAVERVMLSREVIRQGSEAYFRTLVQDTSDVILIINDTGEIRYATPSAKSIFGNERVEGAYLWDVVQSQDRDDIMRTLTRAHERGGRKSYDDWQITRRDNARVEVEVRWSDLRKDRTVGGLVLTMRDVTEQRQLERELKHRAFHDSLTGLPNRVLFQDRTVQALGRSRRTGAVAGVLFVDLDDFKVVNDTMGHSVGDELLVAAGMRLSAVTRASDTTARLAGDEFALLIEDVADSAAVETIADHVVRAFVEPFTLADGSVITTATVGVATTEDSADAGELVRHADLALYAAKAAGKRQWRRYQPVLSTGMLRRRELQAAIDEALVTSAFTLAYQPIVALSSGEIVGFEALVRWPHPRWGMILPDQFIALAEETGHIIPLGSWVLERAATDIVKWQRRVPRRTPLFVSVNVSARQFRDPGFVRGVRQVLTASGLAPSALLLELTESVLLRRDERISSDLRELKGIGLRLAIDDFGTGYSSLSYLRELPIDVLKIDKSFVEGISFSEQRLALAEVIIRIAKTLGLTVMAEGIESEVQRDLLISMGCQFGQGYLLARPVGADQAEALARVGHRPVPELPLTALLEQARSSAQARLPARSLATASVTTPWRWGTMAGSAAHSFAPRPDRRIIQMGCEVSWFGALCDDDYEFLGVADTALQSSWEHCRGIALGAEEAGYDNLLLPSGYTMGIDSVTFAAGIAPLLKRMQLLVAVRMGEMWPPQLGRQLASIDQTLDGRLTINIISSDMPGQKLESAPRYRRTLEIMRVLRDLLDGKPVDFRGEFISVTLDPPRLCPTRGGCPPFYFGGLSEAAREVAAEAADVYLMWPDTMPGVEAVVRDMRDRATRHGRELRFGYRAHVIVRATEHEARAAARRLISRLDPGTGELIRRRSLDTRSVGTARQNELRDLANDEGYVEPNLWTGIGRARSGAGAAIVGDPDQVLAKLRGYADLGMESFILSGYPHAAEADLFARYVLPHLDHGPLLPRARGT